MCSVREMAKRFAAFDPIEAAAAVMADAPQKVLDYNRKQLYEEGIDKNEVALPDYSFNTVQSGYLDNKNNPRLSSRGNGGAYDMKNTGDTYRSLTLDINGPEFSITPHTEYALDRVTEDAYGLTEDSKEAYWRSDLKRGVVEALAAATGCTIS